MKDRLLRLFSGTKRLPAPDYASFSHAHILQIRGLERGDVQQILDCAEHYVARNALANKKHPILGGRTLVTLFYEPSTRTRASFELAGKRLGMDVINLQVAHASVSKGESLLDTARSLEAMQADIVVLRHPHSGAAALLSRYLHRAGIINAGDGAHAHPTQALLDALTLRRFKGRVEGLRVAICGDIRHSRVARSNIALLTLLGAEPVLVAPTPLLPPAVEESGLAYTTRMEAGLAGADAVMVLRLQHERMAGGYVPSAREYFDRYGLNEERLALAKPDALVMHPGPMHRGVEIAGSLADRLETSVVLRQVEHGVALRQALLELLLRRKGTSA